MMRKYLVIMGGMIAVSAGISDAAQETQPLANRLWYPDRSALISMGEPDAGDALVSKGVQRMYFAVLYAGLTVGDELKTLKVEPTYSPAYKVIEPDIQSFNLSAAACSSIQSCSESPANANFVDKSVAETIKRLNNESRYALAARAFADLPQKEFENFVAYVLAVDRAVALLSAGAQEVGAQRETLLQKSMASAHEALALVRAFSSQLRSPYIMQFIDQQALLDGEKEAVWLMNHDKAIHKAIEGTCRASFHENFQRETARWRYEALKIQDNLSPYGLEYKNAAKAREWSMPSDALFQSFTSMTSNKPLIEADVPYQTRQFILGQERKSQTRELVSDYRCDDISSQFYAGSLSPDELQAMLDILIASQTGEELFKAAQDSEDSGRRKELLIGALHYLEQAQVLYEDNPQEMKAKLPSMERGMGKLEVQVTSRVRAMLNDILTAEQQQLRGLFDDLQGAVRRAAAHA